MDMHAIVSPVVSAINPMTPATVSICTGYTTSAAGKQIPTYATATTVTVQAQELSTKELQHLNNLNLVGIMKKFYASVQLKAGDRDDGTGGDIVIWSNDTWLIVRVVESFPQSNWCSAIGQKQVTP